MSSADRGTSAAVLSQRLDKWLWFARVAKSRTLAAAIVAAGKVRVNRVRVVKPSHLVKVGDVITAAATRDVRTLRISAPGTRRGPPSEAMLLYEELTPPPASARSSPASRADQTPELGARTPGSGRPTKRDRRQIDWLKGRD